MFVFLIIVLIYLLAVFFAFGAIWFGDFEYRKKCKTLHEFLFAKNYGNNFNNERGIFIFFPIINIFTIFVFFIQGCINHISEWSKTVKLNRDSQDKYKASFDNLKK